MITIEDFLGQNIFPKEEKIARGIFKEPFEFYSYFETVYADKYLKYFAGFELVGNDVIDVLDINYERFMDNG